MPFLLPLISATELERQKKSGIKGGFFTGSEHHKIEEGDSAFSFNP